jgi:hypothetical protein
VGTTAKEEPVSTFCRHSSMPKKKKALSRFLLKPVPGMRIGPLRLPPGYWYLLCGFFTPAMEFERSFAASL